MSTLRHLRDLHSGTTPAMLLTITTTREPATDLGYLLAKHPERTQTFDLPFGKAHVFYPEAGKLRHRDHRFEWTRAEFAEWCAGAAGRHEYRVRFLPVGPEDPEHGAPTQLGIFAR